MTLKGINWLRLSFWAALLMCAISALLGADRSFWYDEVYTLGAAGVNGELDQARLMIDVHPPSYVLMVHYLSGMTGDNLFALRLVNLIGAAALAAALMVFWRCLSRDRFYITATLLLGNYLCLSLIVELRSYFILFGGCALLQALLLARLNGKTTMDLPMILVGLATTLVHFFGAAFATAALGTSGLQHLAAGRVRHAVWPILGALACIALTFLWVFVISDVTQEMGGKLWITNSIDHYIRFIATQPLLLITAIVALAGNRRAGATAEHGQNIGWLILPALGVLAVGILIGIHTPVITPRNLVVMVPGLCLAVALVMPPRLTTRLAASPLVLLAVVALAGNETRKAVDDWQHIEWAVTEAMPEGCDDVPVYVMGPDIIDGYAQRVFTGKMRRPVHDIPELRDGFDRTLYTNCPLIMGWHQRGGVDNVEAFLTQLNIPHKVRLPDDPTARKTRAATHGFVVDLVTE
ncbi:hypothetical protein [Halovulum sp. GXIMD14793]